MKTVKIDNQEILCQSLKEWIDWRIDQLERRGAEVHRLREASDVSSRLVELLIIREKMDKGVICKLR